MNSIEINRRLIQAEVADNTDLAPDHPDHFRLTINSEWLAKESRPGQFIHILPPTDDEILRRPFSILSTDSSNGFVTILFRIIGDGTRSLSSVNRGDRLDIIGPLGNGFQIEMDKLAILVGGGVGIPPLVFLAEKMKQNSPRICLGARDKKTLVCVDDFKVLGIEPIISTEDGSLGVRGLVTDALNQFNSYDSKSVVYSCGPIPMLAAVAKWSAEKQFQCLVSLESKLACGIGACLGCSVPIREKDGSIHYERVCCDGPVFDASRVAFDLM